jgi:hypothetical protein
MVSVRLSKSQRVLSIEDNQSSRWIQVVEGYGGWMMRASLRSRAVSSCGWISCVGCVDCAGFFNRASYLSCAECFSCVYCFSRVGRVNCVSRVNCASRVSCVGCPHMQPATSARDTAANQCTASNAEMQSYSFTDGIRVVTSLVIIYYTN